MALSPLNLGRVSFNHRTAAMLDSLRQSQMDLLSQETRLASGKSINVGSEDPATAGRVLNLEAALAEQGQLSKNLQYASDFLDASESVITDLSQLLSDAHSIASQNVGDLASPEERTAAAELIADIVEQLVAVGNRQFNGLYLFAGRDTANAPFAQVEGGVAFTGDTGDLLARVDIEDLEAFNLSGDELFGALQGRIQGAVDLDPRITSDTRLDEIRTAAGEALQLGQIVISRATGERFAVDLTSADTMGDIAALINDQAGSAVTAAVGPNGLTLTPVGGPISVADTSTGRIARDLNLLQNNPAAGVIDGSGLERVLTRSTSVADLLAGSGVDLTGGLRITQGVDTASIDLSTAETVQDILNAIDQSGLNIRGEVNADGTGIDIVNLVSGSTLSIAEESGTTAAALGIRTMDSSTPLSSLNHGRGVSITEGETDFRVVARDGSSFEVNLDGAETLGDVITLINTAATDAGVAVTAGLSTNGNGVSLVDGTGGTGTLHVERLNLSYAVDDLGLAAAPDPNATELIGAEVGAIRNDSVLTALLDLERALRSDDTEGITDAGERVYGFIDQVNRVQGVVGARAKSMQARQDHNDQAAFATEQLLSELRDLDYAEAATLFAQAQTALQAALSAGSQSLNLSLLDFIS